MYWLVWFKTLNIKYLCILAKVSEITGYYWLVIASMQHSEKRKPLNET